MGLASHGCVHYETGLAAEVRHKQRRLTEGSSGGFQLTGRVYRYNPTTQSPSQSTQSTHSTLSQSSSQSSQPPQSSSGKNKKGKKVPKGGGAGKGNGGCSTAAAGEEGETLYTITGRFDVRVTVTDVKTGETAVGGLLRSWRYKCYAFVLWGYLSHTVREAERCMMSARVSHFWLTYAFLLIRETVLSRFALTKTVLSRFASIHLSVRGGAVRRRGSRGGRSRGRRPLDALPSPRRRQGRTVTPYKLNSV